jgi:hypothetical protein
MGVLVRFLGVWLAGNVAKSSSYIYRYYQTDGKVSGTLLTRPQCRRRNVGVAATKAAEEEEEEEGRCLRRRSWALRIYAAPLQQLLSLGSSFVCCFYTRTDNKYALRTTQQAGFCWCTPYQA